MSPEILPPIVVGILSQSHSVTTGFDGIIFLVTLVTVIIGLGLCLVTWKRWQ